jgi:xylose isomerase
MRKERVMAKNQFSITAGLWIFAGQLDRYLGSGYSEFLDTEAQIRAAGSVKGLEGVEVIYPWHFGNLKPKQLKRKLADVGLRIVSCNPNIWGEPKLKFGSFSNPDKKIRRYAIDLVKRNVDAAREMGVKDVCLWPGQDGFDYPFQADYCDLWKWEAEGLRSVADYARETDFGIEYKLKEPRKAILVSSAASLIALAAEVGRRNVGAVLDLGHALQSKENPANSACLLSKHRRLFGIHINDNYADWDDDMTVGSIHVWHTIEFIQYLRKVGYNKHLSIDTTPFREDAVESARVCIRNFRKLEKAAERMDEKLLKRLQDASDVLGIQDYLMKNVLK